VRVRLLHLSPRPLDTVVAAARTCYSAELLTAEQVGADGVDDPDLRRRTLERRNRLARSVLEAGHLTTWQHVHLHLAIEGISRLALWCFLHAHPFYNSEQVSQRYVAVDRGSVHVPPALEGAARQRFLEAVDTAHATYHELTGLLEPAAEHRILASHPSWKRAVHRRQLERARVRAAREVARAVLPLATTANLHHTVSLLTALRYLAVAANPDAADEVRAFQEGLRAALLGAAPELEPFLPAPRSAAPSTPSAEPGAFRREFDALLDGRRTVLLSGSPPPGRALAHAVRIVLSAPEEVLPDREAVRLALDPAVNRGLADTLNLATLDPITRTLQQVHLRFATRLSHAADSQNQRHRMVPGARPSLLLAVDDEPDFVIPSLVAGESRALAVFMKAMERSWEAASWLRRNGPDPALALYLLPNALALRIVESSDLAALHHKMRMRLCWNAQDEIRRIAWEQAMQVREADPRVGALLLPPCAVRHRAGVRPYCPEGDRFCGTAVWRLSLEEQEPLMP